MNLLKKFTVPLLIVACSMASCTQETLSEASPSSVDEVQVRLHLKMSSPDNNYALTNDQECHVENIHVFFVNQRTNTVYDVVEGKNIQNVNNIDKTFEASLLLQFGNTDKFDSYVLANIGDFMAGKDKSTFVGKDYAALQLLLQSTITGKLHSTAGNFVMWGKANEALPNISPNKITIPMIRAVARVDIGVGIKTAGGVGGVDGTWNGLDKDGNPIPFVLKTIHVYRPNTAYAYMPLLASYYDVSTKKVTQHSAIGANSAGNATSLAYTVTNGFSQKEIYIAESDVLMGGTGALTDANYTKRCAIVVGGLYNSVVTPTYYRIDFNDNGTPRNLIDVLRNHRYGMNIVSVTGVGYPTADEAYNSVTTGMEAEVIDWTHANQDIVFDGANWFHIERKEMVLGGIYGNTEKLSAESSVDPNDWVLTWKVGGHFTAKKPTIKEGGFLEISTNAGVDLETTDELTIQVTSRLKITIRVRQLPDGYTIEDWESRPENDFDTTVK